MKYLAFFFLPVALTVHSFWLVGSIPQPDPWRWIDSLVLFVFLLLFSWNGWLAAQFRLRDKLKGFEVYLTREAREDVARLLYSLNLPNEWRLLAKALAVIDFLHVHQRTGGTIKLIHPDGTEENLPTLRSEQSPPP